MEQVSHLFIIFLSSFFLVFLLGFQSLTVNAGFKTLAALTSVGIATSNYFIFKFLPSHEPELIEFIFYAAGGPLGIVSSMYVHQYYVKRFRKDKT